MAAHAATPLRRVLQDPVFAVAFVVFGTALVCWPFLLELPPSLSEACSYLFGTWAALVVVLLAMSRALRRDRGRRSGARDG